MDGPHADPERALVQEALGADYEVLEELGRGGMAMVYLARERALDRLVAVKVLPSGPGDDPELVERFQREAKLSAALEHPHIVPIYRVGRSGRVSYFVMQYVRGASLAERLRQEGRLEPKEVGRLLRQVADALHHAHRSGVIHRDIKPDNVMQDQTGRWVVMDFGIAKSLGTSDLTREGGSLGTPRYMSPEQARAEDLDGRSDFYALGAVAYHALAGRPPFDGDEALAILHQHLHDPVPEPILESAPEREVYSLVRGLLAKEPAAREDAMRTLRADGSTLGSGGTAGRAAGWLRARPSPFWMAAGAAAVLLGALLVRDPAAAACREALPDAAADDRALLLEPLGTIDRGTEIEVAFTACGLPEDAVFEARLTIRPADGGGVVGGVRRFLGGGDDPVRITWDDTSDGFGTARERTIDPGELEAGSYRLILQVEDASGREAEGDQEFTVVER